MYFILRLVFSPSRPLIVFVLDVYTFFFCFRVHSTSRSLYSGSVAIEISVLSLPVPITMKKTYPYNFHRLCYNFRHLEQV